jgi:hypothetical protein
MMKRVGEKVVEVLTERGLFEGPGQPAGAKARKRAAS